MSVFVQLLCILILVATCHGDAVADTEESSFAAILYSRAIARTIPGIPEIKPTTFTLPQGDQFAPSRPEANPNISISDPFGLPTIATSRGELPVRWRELLARIVADKRTLSECLSGEKFCTAAARRFLSIVEIGRPHTGRERLGWINRAVNLSVRPASDWAQYGYADYWASPLTTLANQAGDCEDYAILKFAVLAELGVAADDLRLVIVRDDMRQTDHAVLAVRDDAEWLILDNRMMATPRAEQARQYYPMFVMDYRGVRAFSTIAVHR
jgi:predicted transglutaminase-like cysteine proteinase